MGKYDNEKFLVELNRKIATPPKCPFCGHEHFTSIKKYATISISEDFDITTLGPSVPAGMVICQNCGFIFFFSLGILGLLNDSGKGDNNHGSAV